MYEAFDNRIKTDEMRNMFCIYLMATAVVFQPFCGCNKDDDQAPINRIRGKYIGELSDNFQGDILDVEVIVTKLSADSISIEPRDSAYFEKIETEVKDYTGGMFGYKLGNDLELIFNLKESPISLRIARDFNNAHYVYMGEKK